MIKTLASVELCFDASRSRTERQKLIASIFINLSLFSWRPRMECSTWAFGVRIGAMRGLIDRNVQEQIPAESSGYKPAHSGLCGRHSFLSIDCLLLSRFVCDEREYFRQSYRTYHVYLCWVCACACVRKDVILLSLHIRACIVLYYMRARQTSAKDNAHIRIFLCVPNWCSLLSVEWSIPAARAKTIIKKLFPLCWLAI